MPRLLHNPEQLCSFCMPTFAYLAKVTVVTILLIMKAGMVPNSQEATSLQ